MAPFKGSGRPVCGPYIVDANSMSPPKPNNVVLVGPHKIPQGRDTGPPAKKEELPLLLSVYKTLLRNS